MQVDDIWRWQAIGKPDWMGRTSVKMSAACERDDMSLIGFVEVV